MKKKSYYKPTGYPRGRPRKGEIRPPSPHAIAWNKWRKKAGERYKKYNREYHRRWRAAHPERAREITRAARLRKKAWAEVGQ